jgi:nucleoside-diphosphate-sugar epimerase
MGTHLVTGGAGFVGSHIVEHLLDRGESVRIYDVADPDVPGTEIAERATYVEGDVRDRARLDEAMVGVDYVHHTVALVPLTKAGSEFWSVNVDGTENVMAAALEHGVEGVSHVSSSAVYDLSTMPVTEETPRSPIGEYGESKLAGDRVVLEYAERGLPANVLRPRTVLDERRAGIYEILFDWIDRDSPVFMLGDGSNEFQLVSARDFAAASRLAVHADVTGEVFNVGNLQYNELGEDLDHVIDYAGSNSSVIYVPATPARLGLRLLDRLSLSPLAPWHYETVFRDYYFDVSKARSLLGWVPTDSNFEMFERAYDWHASHDVEQTAESGSVHRTAPRQKLLGLVRRLRT